MESGRAIQRPVNSTAEEKDQSLLFLFETSLYELDRDAIFTAGFFLTNQTVKCLSAKIFLKRYYGEIVSEKELARDSSEKCDHLTDKIVYRVILTFKRTSQHSSYSNLVFCRTPSMGDERRSPSEINGEIDEKAMLKTKNGRKNGKRHFNGSINGSAKKIKKVDNEIS